MAPQLHKPLSISSGITLPHTKLSQKNQAEMKIRICKGKAREGSEFLLGCARRGLQCTNSIPSHFFISVTAKKVAKKKNPFSSPRIGKEKKKDICNLERFIFSLQKAVGPHRLRGGAQGQGWPQMAPARVTRGRGAPSGVIPMGKARLAGAVNTCSALLHPLVILINYPPFLHYPHLVICL